MRTDCSVLVCIAPRSRTRTEDYMTGAPDQAIANAWKTLIGPEIVAWVNKYRLAGLPALGPFTAGASTVTMTNLVEGLPSLVPLIEKQVDAGIAADEALRDLKPFDE